MAEARRAVSFLDIHDVSEGRDTWKDALCEIRKGVKRRYYRTRNSIRNGLWPTSLWNLGLAWLVAMSLMYLPTELTSCGAAWLNRHLWRFVAWLNMHHGIPLVLQAILASSLVAVIFFLVLMFIRRQVLRLLLSYHGWMYEPPRTMSWLTRGWALVVKVFSGYHPSLYSYQRSLPTMSVPPLAQTVSRLTQSLRPLLPHAEYEQLEQQAAHFLSGVGPKLQRLLWLKSWWSQNYVSDWWEKYVYLMSRSSLVISSNYYILDYSYYVPTHNQIARASFILSKLVEFKRLVDREQLEPLLLRGTIPLCMSQYERIFSTTRIPRAEIDQLKHYTSKHSKHVVIYSNGIYYKLDLYDTKGQILTVQTIEQQLRWIVDDSKKLSQEYSDEEKCVCTLTSLGRAEWARCYQQYLSGAAAPTVNRDAIDVINKAICVMILSTYSPRDVTDKANYLLHGAARHEGFWYDKGFNLVVFADGQSGFNCEHSLADAPIYGHLVEYVYSHELLYHPYCDCGRLLVHAGHISQATVPAPRPLQWQVNTLPPLANTIRAATHTLSERSADVDLVIVDHHHYGSAFIKGCKVSPDAYIQLAIQLAYYRESGGRPALTYEASMTRLYLAGRTETVRSLTLDSLAFCRAMCGEDGEDGAEGAEVSVERKVSLLQQAAATHQLMYKDAMNGLGVDRHLFCLYVLCKGLGYESDFLHHVLHKEWTLSTSQQPQQQMTTTPSSNLPQYKEKVSPGGGFGPVSDQGYGISYMIPRDDKIFFHVSSKKSCAETGSTRFAQGIFRSLADMRDLFRAANKGQQNNHVKESRS